MGLKKLRDDIYKILNSALSSVDPYNLIKEQIIRDKNILIFPDGEKIDLSRYKRIYLCGAGKGAAPMCKAMEEILAERLYEGNIIVKYEHVVNLEKTNTYQAGHPIPDDNTLKGTNKIIESVDHLNKDDCVFVILTGGGSALLELLAADITLQDLQEMNKILLQSGATIHEINCIRKHISKIKGGQLARIIQPARCISLALSDVVGDNLSVIASGPTYPDDTTFNQAWLILEKYQLKNKIPVRIINYIQAGMEGRVPETPKKDDEFFKNVTNRIIGNNRLALHSAENTAKSMGFNTLILTSMVQGEAKEIAKLVSAMIQEIQRSNIPIPKPACLLLGGEPTVTIKGNGKGGRNQELAMALAMTGINEDYIFLSCGSDGTDGPTDAAGAIVTNNTILEAEKKNLDAQEYLRNNDAYNFFEPLNGLIKTGPTKTNVMDIMIAIIP